MPPEPAAAPASDRRSASLARARQLSHLLDKAIALPGTGCRVGLDPLIGLIPAAGDYLSAGLSAYIIWEAAQLGASKRTLSRMVLNVVWDALAGTVPVLGDLFDVAWKANTRNVALLEAHATDPQQSDRADTWFVAVLLAVIAIAVIGTTLLSLFLLALLWHGLTQWLR